MKPSSQQVLRHSGFFFLLSFAHFFLHFFRVFGGFLTPYLSVSCFYDTRAPRARDGLQ